MLSIHRVEASAYTPTDAPDAGRDSRLARDHARAAQIWSDRIMGFGWRMGRWEPSSLPVGASAVE